ncbi:hypothetical protein DIE08_22605 [Burkholderia sp. Bp9004]|nr:hypothetical protein DIE08_22605 [Burkholderia sp. Bp9004]
MRPGPGQRTRRWRLSTGGRNRRRAVPTRQAAPRSVPRRAIWRFRRKLAIIRWPVSAAIHSNCGRARVQQPIITPSNGEFAATQYPPVHRPIIAALQQAATNLKKLKQGPTGAHPAAPAFRDSACRACAAARACMQEARRR